MIWEILKRKGCWHVYMAISFWEISLLVMAVVDFPLAHMGAFLSSDRCYLVIFSGSRGTISESCFLRFRRDLSMQTLSGSNTPFRDPL